MTESERREIVRLWQQLWDLRVALDGVSEMAGNLAGQILVVARRNREGSQESCGVADGGVPTLPHPGEPEPC